ncbi:MAG: tyrosine-type recombinase/integrase [Proteobacteria bacterium]|nr:tyrosine-type recombinase/integrase [Pseudomonadota bacterium]
MGRKRTPGLVRRQGLWHIDKRIGGRRVCQSTGTAKLEEAELFLARQIEESRQAQVYGVRPARSFELAAVKFVRENQHKRTIRNDIAQLKRLMPWIGSLPLKRIHIGVLQSWIEHRRKEGVATGTINHGLKVVRRILNLAQSDWLDENGLTWLAAAPKIKLLPDTKKRQPYPLNWEEQQQLFSALPAHLAEMALYAVNTGCRDAEICNLRWDWEVKVSTLETFVFIVPGEFVKNGDERLVVLNDIARSVVNARRGKHPTHVFAYKGKPVTRLLNSSWCRVRRNLGLEQVRVHDLKHTFGRRLRAAGVSFEDRQDLLGHRSGRMTTHYSAAELSKLIEAANSVCERSGNKPELVVLRRIGVS